MEDLVKLCITQFLIPSFARFEKISRSLVIAVTKPLKVWCLDLPQIVSFQVTPAPPQSELPNSQ